MSSDYFFFKWKEILKHLEQLVLLDLEFQETKTHDKKLCDAVIRLNGMLGEYISIYKATLECLQNNLQVQKTQYQFEVVRAITNRILELKHELRKLECSDTQFLGHGLADHKLTTYDAELDDVPILTERPDDVKIAIAEAFIKAEKKREHQGIAEEAEETDDEPKGPDQIWRDEENPGNNNEKANRSPEPEPEETIQIEEMAMLIQAHERARQVIRLMNYNNLKRQIWEKELCGASQPPAPLELRVRAAKIIQKVCRAYFEIKRKKMHECQQDESLGIRLCGKANKAHLSTTAEVKQLRYSQRKEFENQRDDYCKRLKQDFIKRKGDDFADDYRGFIRQWFRKWFDDIHYFNDVPNEDEGGSVLIVREETPEPTEWWQTYQAYLEEKKANKNKSAQQLKFAKLEAKREEMMRKKEEKMKLKLEADLMKKMMKNPTMHPGYKYPESKKTEHILEVIENYHRDWDELDQSEILEVKKKFVADVDEKNIYAEAKINILQSVDEDMREELKVLKKALKTDYENNGEKFPEPMKNPKKRAKKMKKAMKMSESIAEKMEDLAFKGIMKEYPSTKLGDFLGDHNYAGDDQRCNFEQAFQFCGEARSIWWEKCREATHGYHKLLLVGPNQSGKTLLVHALATVTDSILFELDPLHIHSLTLSSSAELQRLMASVVICARAAQPSVIYIKHIQRLFYKKVPPEEADIDLALIKRMILRKLLKKINRTDKITVIGSCVDPWLTKSSQLLKQFPVVVLIPDTSYSAVFRLLKHWLNDNHSLPRELDINSLAFVLRGYSYGQLKEGLKEFLTPERIIKIAVHGLFPIEIYNFFLDDETKIKVEYEKYLKWYYEQTQWGKKEKTHIEEQREFLLLSQKYAEKNKKKKNPSATSSATTMRTIDE